MKQKEVKLPFGLQNKLLESFLRSRPGVLLSNWVFQGMRYMNRYEVMHRLILETISICLVYLVSSRWLLSPFQAFLVSILLVHTLFWLFNGHFYVLMRYLNERNNDPMRFLRYIEELYERVKGREFLRAVVGFGSLSRGAFSPSSDFDVRFLMKPGFGNRVKAFNLCAWERARAFVQGFPLDIYVFELEDLARKIREDEPPIIIRDPEGIFHQRQDRIDFEKFRSMFRSLVLGEQGPISSSN